MGQLNLFNRPIQLSILTAGLVVVVVVILINAELFHASKTTTNFVLYGVIMAYISYVDNSDYFFGLWNFKAFFISLHMPLNICRIKSFLPTN